MSARGSAALWAPAIIGLLSSPAAAETATLEWVRARALAEHPELVAEDARVVSARAGQREAESARLPRVNGKVDVRAGPGGQLVTVEEPPGSGRNLRVSGAPELGDEGAFSINGRWGVGVGLDWRLYDFGRTGAAVRAARWERRAREAERAATTEELVRAVDAAYLDWLDAAERSRLQADAVERARQRLTRLEGRQEAGALAAAEVWPARTDLAARELSLAEAAQVRDEARLALEAASGVGLPEDATPDRALLDFGAPPPKESALPDRATQVLKARAEAATARAQRIDRERVPELNGSANFGVRGQIDAVFPNYSLGLALKVPIWQGGEKAAQAAAARADAEALRAQAESTSAEHGRELARATLALQAARRRVDLAQQLVSATEGRLAAVEARPEGELGRADELDRVRAERDRAVLSLLSARIDRAFATLRLTPVVSTN